MNAINSKYNLEMHEAELENKMPKTVVIIPIMNTPIFPGMVTPIILSEERYTKELDKTLMSSGYAALNLVKYDLKDKDGNFLPEDMVDLENREITKNDIYKVGVICRIVKKIKLADGTMNLVVHGVKRYRVCEFLKKSSLIRAKYETFEDILTEDDELDAYTRSVINQVKKISDVNPYFNEEMKLAILNSPSPGTLADLVAFALSLDIPEAQDFLETLVVKKRFAKLLVYLQREKEVTDIQKKISDEVNDKVNKYQREYLLREQLKIIRTELGMDQDDKSRDLKIIKEKLSELKLSKEVQKSVDEELDKIESISESSPEYTVSRTYLHTIIALPWNKSSEHQIDIDEAAKVLEKDHFGLEKAKERILEYLAVRKLNPGYDGTLLCLAGPPGVGKTSLGKSIASALGRKFYRFSLGGMRDEAEIKGHRRTYIGAVPGKIIQALKRVEVNNPVIMLDEIDKLASSYQGDPASALLEVLDPEQNKTFIDNYLDVPFDLSKVLFISTANYVGNIPEPLLDRMELISLAGYSLEEKLKIAEKWIIKKELKKHGLVKSDLKINRKALKQLISDYAREPGVRVLEQYIAKICRKAVLEKVKKTHSKKTFEVKAENLEKLLGPIRFQSEIAQKHLKPGTVTGLAWTAYGGEILFIETITMRGKGGFQLTGQLGDVMNESAKLAYSYVKKILQKDSKEEDFLSSHEIHLHLPAGATPKDGPSAGITMATALYSLATNTKIKPTLAMTGELSLTGRVLPVGGVKEKVLAAKRAGVKVILLPKDNYKDLKEVPESHRKGMTFYPVEIFEDVLKLVFK